VHLAEAAGADDPYFDAHGCLLRAQGAGVS
jgi:hypothetical protein